MKSLLRRSLPQSGYSMAWWAAFLAFVLAPLMSLAVDVTRLMFVRTDLQTAVDAACEAAALSADTAHFNQTGMQRIDPGLAGQNASGVFRASVYEAGLILYSPSLQTVQIIDQTVVSCTAHASLQPLIPVSPALEINVAAGAKMRFIER